MRKIIKITLLSLICFACIAVNAQDEFSSFYFSEPQPSNYPEITEFDEDHLGVYRLTDQKYTRLVIEKDSIAAKYLIAFELTIDEIEADEKFYIENELLYGVTPAGLHFINENDTLLIALNQEELYCSFKDNVIKKDGDTYFINSEESSGRWRTIVVNASSKGLEVLDLDHGLAIKSVAKMEKIKEVDDDILVYIATPSSKQFLSLVKSRGYQSEPILYKKD